MTSPYYIPRVPMSAHIPSLYSVKFPKKTKLQVLTDTILNKYLFCDVPKNQTDVVSVAILGRRASGKSTMITSIASIGFDRYGPDNLNVLYSDDLDYCTNNFDRKDVQMVFVDDAMKKQSSRRIHANTDKVGDYNNIRHLYEEKTGKKNGLIIIVFAWQRWMDLDPAFRDSMDLIFLKTSSYSKEKNTMIEMFGKDCYRYITENYDLIRRGDNKAKSRSIVHVASLEGTGNENGVFILDKLDCPLMPKFVNVTNLEGQIKAESDVPHTSLTLEDLVASEDDKLKLKAKCYEMIYINHQDCRSTGLTLGISHSSAARYAKDIKDMLSSSDSNEGASA